MFALTATAWGFILVHCSKQVLECVMECNRNTRLDWRASTRSNVITSKSVMEMLLCKDDVVDEEMVTGEKWHSLSIPMATPALYE